jgi:carbon starvation protein CstA
LVSVYKLDFNEALYSLLPAVLWLAVFLSAFIFSLIPIWGLGSKRDFLIPLLLGFAYGVAYMGVKASAFHVVVNGHKINGVAFVPVYFLAFCLVVGPVIYYFMK